MQLFLFLTQSVALIVWLFNYQISVNNRPVAEELLEAGVPKEDIILGFHPPEVRQYTDFSVA